MKDLFKNLTERLRNQAPQAILYNNITRKESLSSTYGFNRYDEKVSVVFALLSYILEKSLKDEECTLNDMAEYLEFVNEKYFHKDLEKEDYFKLANCIVNEVILNDGNMTEFRYLNIEKTNTDQDEYKNIYIQLIEHERSSSSNAATYKLTEMGYRVALSTLEMESNMKLKFQDFVFKESLHHKNYDQALVDIKNIYALSKQQIKALRDGITKVRENVNEFSEEEYNRIIDGSIEVVEEQNDKFESYEREVARIEQDLKDQEFKFLDSDYEDSEELDEIRKNLKKVDLIKKELYKVIYEHSQMTLDHFTFKNEYSRTLLNSISTFKRDKINIKEELESLIVKDLSKIEFLDFLFSPLFIKDIKKEYNLLSAFAPQKSKIIERETASKVDVVVDKEEKEIQRRIQEEKNREKLEQYENILGIIFNFGAKVNQSFTLSEFIQHIENLEEFDILTKNMYQLREVLIELLDLRNINIEKFKKEARMLKAGYDNTGDFQPLKAILYTIKNNNLNKIVSIKLVKLNDDKVKVTKDYIELTIDNVRFEFNLL